MSGFHETMRVQWSLFMPFTKIVQQCRRLADTKPSSPPYMNTLRPLDHYSYKQRPYSSLTAFPFRRPWFLGRGVTTCLLIFDVRRVLTPPLAYVQRVEV